MNDSCLINGSSEKQAKLSAAWRSMSFSRVAGAESLRLLLPCSIAATRSAEIKETRMKLHPHIIKMHESAVLNLHCEEMWHPTNESEVRCQGRVRPC